MFFKAEGSMDDSKATKILKPLELNSGKVVAFGPSARSRDGSLIPVSAKKGDVVLLPEYGGTEVKLEDMDLMKLILQRRRASLNDFERFKVMMAKIKK